MVKSNYMTLRGMHYQIEPFGQTKLINVSEGSILDVVIDLRKNLVHTESIFLLN